MAERWNSFVGTFGFPVLVSMAGSVVLLLLVVAWLRWRRVRAAKIEPGVSRGGCTAPVGEGVGPGSLRDGLAKTRAGVLQRLLPLLGRDRLDAGAVEALEAALLAADVGVQMTQRLVRCLQDDRSASGLSLKARLEREVIAILEVPISGGASSGSGDCGPPPHVLMLLGVNGVGKTTTIGKLAARYIRAGRRTLLVAADTFRAAASEQLAVWAERTGADLVRHQQGGDPGAVAYDGLRAALARGADVVIIDTAGRLHTKNNLMEELSKVRRVIAREIPGAPHETLLVIDAVTGQNGLAQARAFLGHIEITGIVLTKLDGTARGGIVLAITGELGIPIRYVGIGEGVDDLQEFDPREFAAALLAPMEPAQLT